MSGPDSDGSACCCLPALARALRFPFIAGWAIITSSSSSSTGLGPTMDCVGKGMMSSSELCCSSVSIMGAGVFPDRAVLV